MVPAQLDRVPGSRIQPQMPWFQPTVRASTFTCHLLWLADRRRAQPVTEVDHYAFGALELDLVVGRVHAHGVGFATARLLDRAGGLGFVFNRESNVRDAVGRLALQGNETRWQHCDVERTVRKVDGAALATVDQ